MSSEEIALARDRVRHVLGQAVEEKSTDEFCISFARPRREFAERWIRAQPEIAPVGTVVELAGQEESIERLVPSQAIAIAALEEVTDAIRRAADAMPDVPIRLDRALRDAVVRAVREEAYRDAGHLYDSLERVTGGPLRPGIETVGSVHTPSIITEYCWLNRSIRTWADPVAIADVAADPKVERIDLPRLLETDVSGTAGIIQAPNYRAAADATGEGVVVGILDSEVAIDHPAFGGRVVHRMNYTREPWGNPDEHGTAVAGIAASGDPAVQGIAPQAAIHNYKVLATSRILSGDDFSGAVAIQQALEDGVDVANCSWGAGPAGTAKSREARAVDAAWALGLTIVKSAGNQGAGRSSITTPADADGVVVVGATDRGGAAVEPYSSRGPAPDGTSRPHLVAPGGSEVDPMISCRVGGGMGPVGFGTSFAAPHVAGLVALLIEAKPELSPDQIRDALLAACVPLPAGDENTQGHGLIKAAGLPA